MTLKGAEAEIEIDEGKVTKRRAPKSYRHEDLDERIREERTRRELDLLVEARKHGVNVPDAKRSSEHALEIERIEGEQLKDVIETSKAILEEVGRDVARLHDARIIHGDLTTRNIMVDEEPYLLDFGLSSRSERTEDMAVDLHLLKQTLETTHPEIAEEAWEKFREGYREYDGSGQVLERLEEVEKRGRYK